MKLINSPKDFLQVCVILLFLLSPFYLFFNYFYYIDLSRLSFIKIDNNFYYGEKKNLKKSIKLIKKNNPLEYQRLTKYVDHVGEKFCEVADWQYDRAAYLEGRELPACYIRGSKTIYLKPEASASAEVISRRAEEIIRMAKLSQDFWSNK